MIYVDQLFNAQVYGYKNGDGNQAQAARVGARNNHQWCHMWTDGEPEELHAFAKRIGLKREWAQPSQSLLHYDLTPSKREKAVKLGAVETRLREWLDSKRQTVAQEPIEPL